MPIYEYKCGRCKEDFEELYVSIDPDLNYDFRNCPAEGCGGEGKRKLSVTSNFTGKRSGSRHFFDFGSVPDSRPGREGDLFLLVTSASGDDGEFKN